MLLPFTLANKAARTVTDLTNFIINFELLIFKYNITINYSNFNSKMYYNQSISL